MRQAPKNAKNERMMTAFGIEDKALDPMYVHENIVTSREAILGTVDFSVIKAKSPPAAK